MFSTNSNESIPRIYPPPNSFRGEDIIGDALYGNSISTRSKQPPNLGQKPIPQVDYEEYPEEDLQNTPAIFIEKQISNTQNEGESIVKNIKINLTINLKINVI